MPYVCKFCIAQRGLKASELDQHARDYETIARHVEAVHHYAAPRSGETRFNARMRVLERFGEVKSADDVITALIGGPNHTAARLIELTDPVVAVAILKDEDRP